MAYTIEILGVDKTNYLRAGTLKVTKRAGNKNECSLSITTTAAGYLPDVGQDIKIKDSGTVIFGGCIKTISMRKLEIGYGNSATINLDITSDGYNHIPARRTVTDSFDQKSAGYVVNLYTTAFLDDEGVTVGDIDTGADPVGDMGEYDAICKSLQTIFNEMASASGYKWYINDSKELYFIADDAVVNAAHDIVEGGAFTDFQIDGIEVSLEEYTNKVFVRGGTADDGTPIKCTGGYIEDAIEQAARQTAEGGAGYSTGVYGIVINDSNISNVSDADTAANNQLKKYGIIPKTITFTSFTNDWDAGTKLKVNLPTFGISADAYFLIEEVAIEDIGNQILRSSVKASVRKAADFSTQPAQSGIDYLGKMVEKINEASNKKTVPFTFLSEGVTKNIYVGYKVQLTGTIEVINDGGTFKVIGTGTQFLTEVSAGDVLVTYVTYAGNLPFRLDVISVTNDTEAITSTPAVIAAGQPAYNCLPGSDSNDGTAADASHALATIGAAVLKMSNYIMVGSCVQITAVIGDYPEYVSFKTYGIGTGTGGVIFDFGEGLTTPYATSNVTKIGLIDISTSVVFQNFKVSNELAFSYCNHVTITNGYVNGGGSLSYALLADDSNVKIYYSYLYAINQAILAQGFTKVHTFTNYGSAAYGLYAQNGAEIIKYDATQPTGTTSNEFTIWGGLIR